MYKALKRVLGVAIDEHKCEWVVREEDSGSVLRQVDLCASKVSFYALSQAVYKGWGGSLCGCGGDCDCDGIAWVDSGKPPSFPLLVELKTTFTENAIKKSCRQIGVSVLKLHMLLSLIDGYAPGVLPKIVAIVVCSPPSKKLEADIKQRVESCRMAKRALDPVAELYMSRSIKGCLGDLPVCANAGLNQNLMASNFELHLFLADMPNVVCDISHLVS